MREVMQLGVADLSRVVVVSLGVADVFSLLCREMRLKVLMNSHWSPSISNLAFPCLDN